MSCIFQTMVHMEEDETAIDVRQVDYTSVDFQAHTLDGVCLMWIGLWVG